MAYVLPTFNLKCGIHRWPIRFDLPADLIVDCQIRGPGSTYSATAAGTIGYYGITWLILPPLTDIRDTYCEPINSNDGVEVPLGSGRYYMVTWVEDIAKGFSNEHKYALLVKNKQNVWPTPIP